MQEKASSVVGLIDSLLVFLPSHACNQPLHIREYTAPSAGGEENGEEKFERVSTASFPFVSEKPSVKPTRLYDRGHCGRGPQGSLPLHPHS